MKTNKILLLVFVAVFMVIAGCKAGEKEPVAETTEEVVDSGSLIVESSPSSAQVYVGEEFKGDTPVTLYNLPVGKYDITVKKDGYADFKKTVAIKVGKIEEVDATLASISVEGAKPILKEPEKEAKPEDAAAPAVQNRINLSAFAVYYDFDKMQFTELRTEGSDLFSRKYDKYVHFTSITPAKIKLIQKPLKEIQQVDCINADYGIAQLYSGQALCVISAEGATFAISGTWEANPTELEWVKLG